MIHISELIRFKHIPHAPAPSSCDVSEFDIRGHRGNYHSTLHSMRLNILSRSLSTRISDTMNRLVSRVFLRRGVRALHSTRPLRLAEEASGGEVTAKLNFALPHEAIYHNEPVHSVVIPGLVGEYGVSGQHQPVLSELKAGVVQVYKTEQGEPEKYFISGGFALTHEDATTDISAAEGFKLDELDGATAAKLFAEAKAKVDAAPADSEERAHAQVQMDTYEAICVALGVAAS